MQALVSVVEDGQDTLETITAGETQFVFLHKSPLILVAVSKLKDSIVQLQLQLKYFSYQCITHFESDVNIFTLCLHHKLDIYTVKF